MSMVKTRNRRKPCGSSSFLYHFAQYWWLWSWSWSMDSFPIVQTMDLPQVLKCFYLSLENISWLGIQSFLEVWNSEWFTITPAFRFKLPTSYAETMPQWTAISTGNKHLRKNGKRKQWTPGQWAFQLLSRMHYYKRSNTKILIWLGNQHGLWKGNCMCKCMRVLKKKDRMCNRELITSFLYIFHE